MRVKQAAQEGETLCRQVGNCGAHGASKLRAHLLAATPAQPAVADKAHATLALQPPTSAARWRGKLEGGGISSSSCPGVTRARGGRLAKYCDLKDGETLHSLASWRLGSAGGNASTHVMLSGRTPRITAGRQAPQRRQREKAAPQQAQHGAAPLPYLQQLPLVAQHSGSALCRLHILSIHPEQVRSAVQEAAQQGCGRRVGEGRLHVGQKLQHERKLSCVCIQKAAPEKRCA